MLPYGHSSPQTGYYPQQVVMVANTTPTNTAAGIRGSSGATAYHSDYLPSDYHLTYVPPAYGIPPPIRYSIDSTQNRPILTQAPERFEARVTRPETQAGHTQVLHDADFASQTQIWENNWVPVSAAVDPNASVRLSPMPPCCDCMY
eukprot:Trichotokara_eunicae@DN9085_c0_g1_i1.p1